MCVCVYAGSVVAEITLAAEGKAILMEEEFKRDAVSVLYDGVAVTPSSIVVATVDRGGSGLDAGNGAASTEGGRGGSSGAATATVAVVVVLLVALVAVYYYRKHYHAQTHLTEMPSQRAVERADVSANLDAPAHYAVEETWSVPLSPPV